MYSHGAPEWNSARYPSWSKHIDAWAAAGTSKHLDANQWWDCASASQWRHTHCECRASADTWAVFEDSSSTSSRARVSVNETRFCHYLNTLNLTYPSFSSKHTFSSVPLTESWRKSLEWLEKYAIAWSPHIRLYCIWQRLYWLGINIHCLLDSD